VAQGLPFVELVFVRCHLVVQRYASAEAAASWP
jgi:hypothetical protein